MELVSTLTHALSGQNQKSTLDGRIKLYSSNIAYLFDVLNPRKDKDNILTEFAYDPVFFAKEENMFNASTSTGAHINLIFPVHEIIDQKGRVSLEEADFFSNNLYELIIRAMNEPQKDDIMPINIFYHLKVIERILVSDTEQLKNKKRVFDIEKGLSLEDYVKFSMKLKGLCLKLIRYIVEKYKSYTVRYMDWITNALYYLYINFKE